MFTLNMQYWFTVLLYSCSRIKILNIHKVSFICYCKLFEMSYQVINKYTTIVWYVLLNINFHVNYTQSLAVRHGSPQL